VTRCPICGEFNVVLVIHSFTRLGSCPKCGATWVHAGEEQRGVTTARPSLDGAADPEPFVTDWALAE